MSLIMEALRKHGYRPVNGLILSASADTRISYHHHPITD